jgi:hypothetical protein
MLTIEQKATNYDTQRHIHRVQQLLAICINNLLSRAIDHDQSKLQSPEVELFTEYTNKLAHSTYGSDEYKDFLVKLKPALDHHYASNSHHPEHYEQGIDGMDLLDLLEMICDWKAASERQRTTLSRATRSSRKW